MAEAEVVSLNELTRYLRRLVEKRLWLKVFICLVLGAGVGFVLGPGTDWLSEQRADDWSAWLALPGNLFLRLVQMIMIPLIFSSIITGIISNSSDQLRQMGLKLLAYFLTTTLLSISIGSVLALWIKPGSRIQGLEAPAASDLGVGATGSLLQRLPDSIGNLLPNNPLAAMVSGEMLGVVIFSIIIGIAVMQLKGSNREALIKLLEATQSICMTVVGWAMRLVPYAVFGMVAALVLSVGLQSMASLLVYMGVVVLGLLVLLILYLLAVTLLGKRSPWKFLAAVREAQLLAFATTSSAAVMPLTMKTADEKLGISSKVSDFIIPIGATINMDGTAIFQCVTTVFIAQAYGMELPISQLLLVMVTILAASIGTPAVPGGGVVVMASVLQSAGIPAEGLMLIIGVDRILGMFRTAINVTGDLVACVLFQRWITPEKVNQT